MLSILIFFFFFTFSAFSPKFGKLFGEVSFLQGGFSAKWLFGEVVFGKVSCIETDTSCQFQFYTNFNQKHKGSPVSGYLYKLYVKDLIQKQKIDTQNIIFKISFRTKSLRFEFRRETRRIHFQYPSHDDHFRRETPRNFAAKFLLYLAVSPRNCQFRVCSFRVSPKKCAF